MQKYSYILVINCGSSSLKFSLFDTENLIEHVAGIADRLGTDKANLTIHEKNNPTHNEPIKGTNHLDALNALIQHINKQYRLSNSLVGVGHRVVHGGEAFSKAVRMNKQNIEAIKRCSPLAPLHNPANILGIETLQSLFPDVPQVAVFDTAFHQTIPKSAFLYPIPYELYTKHRVRRYGFHGTSHAYVANQAVKQLALSPTEHAIICAHLGNGCSATAVKNGKSVDTTMGMTPLEGLCMGTRSGDIDPSIHQYLCDKLELNINEVTHLLNTKSGLLGLSQRSNDMRTLSEAAANGDQQAQLAIEVFCYRLAKAIAGLCVPLGKLNALVFTGGIGENAANIRAKVCNQLGFLGITLNSERNNNHGKNYQNHIEEANSLPVLVIKTQEEQFIASSTLSIINQQLA